jgi:hypothetical protein
MALSTKQIGSATASSVAAATTRVGQGGRNVASSTRPDVERLDYAQHMGLNEESILRFQQETGVNPDGSRRQRDDRSPFTWQTSMRLFSFGTDSAEDGADNNSGKLFLNDVMRGIGTYEENIRITSPGTPKPGSVMNYLF